MHFCPFVLNTLSALLHLCTLVFLPSKRWITPNHQNPCTSSCLYTFYMNSPIPLLYPVIHFCYLYHCSHVLVFLPNKWRFTLNYWELGSWILLPKITALPQSAITDLNDCIKNFAKNLPCFVWSIICYAPHKAWQIFDKIFDVFVKLILSQIIIGWTLAITDTLTYGMIILSSNWVNVILCKIKNAGRYNFPTNFDLVKLSLTSHTVLGVVWCWSLTRAMIKISSEVPTGHSSLPSVCQIYCFLSTNQPPWLLKNFMYSISRVTD